MDSSHLRSSRQGDVNDLLGVIRGLKTEIEALKRKCVRITTENRRLEREKDDLQKQLVAHQTGRVAMGGVSAKQKALQRAVAEQQRQLKAQAMQAVRSDEDTGNMRARVESLVQQVQTLEAEVDESRRERDQAREETEQLRDQMARRSSSQQERIEQELGTLRQQLEAGMQDREKSLVVSLEESKAEAQRLVQEASQASETLKRRDAELQDKDQEIDDLKSRMAAGNPNQQPTSVSESQPISNLDQQPEAASEKQRQEVDVADSRSNVSGSPSERPLRQSDAESAPLASKGVVDQVVDHSLLIVEQLEKAVTATKSAVAALVGSPRGVEELPADVQGPYREACSVLSETEAVVESSLKSCHKNAISELHDVDETISLLCSEQLLALQRAISKAVAGILQVAGCALDGAMYAGNAFKPGYVQEQWSLHVRDLLHTINMTSKGIEQIVNAEIPSMVAKLQAASLLYVEDFQSLNWESKFMSDALQTLMLDWGDSVDKSAQQISKAVGTARERIEDPALANSELKSIQTLIQELSLQIGSVVHVRRSRLMKAGLCEGQHFGPDALNSHMTQAMENVSTIAGRWANAFPNLTSVSSSSAQAWQALSLRARRCLALEAFKWIGYMSDVASDTLIMSGGRAQALKIVTASSEHFFGQLFPAAGSELSRINDPTAPLSGSDEAQYESRAVVNAVKADFVEAVALVERRTMQVLLTSVGLLEITGQDQTPLALYVTPASVGANHTVAVKRVPLNLRRHQAAANGVSEDEDIRSKAILLERTAIAKTVFLVVDPKPYEGMAPTPEEKSLDEHNKKLIQAVKKVAGKLRWEVRNVKDIERLADEGVDEAGLLDTFDVILKPRLPASLPDHSEESQGDQIAEALALSGVPVHEIALDTMLAASEDEHAQQLLDLAIEGRISLGNGHSGGDAGVHISAKDMEEMEAAGSSLDAAIRKAHTEFQQRASSISGVDMSRATKSLENEVHDALTSVSRTWSAALKGVQQLAYPEPPALEDCRNTFRPLAASQSSERAPSTQQEHSAGMETASNLPAETVKLVQPPPASNSAGQYRYAPSTASTESEEGEEGVTPVQQQGRRRTSFSGLLEDDSDETVTQSFSELSRDF